MPLLLSPLAARSLHAPLLPASAAAAAPQPSRLRPLAGEPRGRSRGRLAVVSEKQAAAVVAAEKSLSDEEARYDAIVVGSGIGGLVAATQLAAKGARVLVLEKYIIPGGSSGYYRRDGFTFDVGSSVMFGFSDKVS
jgi:prolycopene isomerase